MAVVTRLEAYRKALQAAVRDGDRAVAKALTAAVFAEISKRPSNVVEIRRR